MNALRVVCLTLTVTAIGCSKGDGPGYVTTEGVVTLDGNPVEGAHLTFSPEPGQGNTGTVSLGLTNAEGKFKMRTGTGKVGAAVGKHKVAIELIVTPEAPPAPAGDGLAPALPNEMTAAEARVFAAAAATAPKPLYLVPKKYADPKTSGLTAEVPPGGVTDLKFELTVK